MDLTVRGNSIAAALKGLQRVIVESRGGATLESLIKGANEKSTLFIFGICDLYYKKDKQIKGHGKRDLERQIDLLKGK